MAVDGVRADVGDRPGERVHHVVHVRDGGRCHARGAGARPRSVGRVVRRAGHDARLPLARLRLRALDHGDPRPGRRRLPGPPARRAARRVEPGDERDGGRRARAVLVPAGRPAARSVEPGAAGVQDDVRLRHRRPPHVGDAAGRGAVVVRVHDAAERPRRRPAQVRVAVGARRGDRDDDRRLPRAGVRHGRPGRPVRYAARQVGAEGRAGRGNRGVPADAGARREPGHRRAADVVRARAGPLPRRRGTRGQHPHARRPRRRRGVRRVRQRGPRAHARQPGARAERVGVGHRGPGGRAGDALLDAAHVRGAGPAARRRARAGAAGRPLLGRHRLARASLAGRLARPRAGAHDRRVRRGRAARRAVPPAHDDPDQRADRGHDDRRGHADDDARLRLGPAAADQPGDRPGRPQPRLPGVVRLRHGRADEGDATERDRGAGHRRDERVLVLHGGRAPGVRRVRGPAGVGEPALPRGPGRAAGGHGGASRSRPRSSSTTTTSRPRRPSRRSGRPRSAP